MEWTRRRFLLLGTAATGVLATAYATLRQVGEYPPSDLGLELLGDKEVHILRVVGNWAIPPGGPFPSSGGDDAAIVGIERFIAALDVPTRLRETGAVRAELPLVAEAVREELAGSGAEPGEALEGLLEQMW